MNHKNQDDAGGLSASSEKERQAKVLYEIVNPSDPYTFRAASDLIAAAATLVISGKYGCTRHEIVNGSHEEKDVGSFYFGGIDPDGKGHSEKYEGMTIREFFKANWEAIADALDSVLIGSLGERKLADFTIGLLLKSGGEDAVKEYTAERDDVKRSSMTNIGAMATDRAAIIREREGDIFRGGTDAD